MSKTIPFSSVGEGVFAKQLQVFVAIEGAVLGIDDPDFRDPHCAVVFQLSLHTLQAVLRRQNLKNSKRRVSDDLLIELAHVQHCDIGNAIPRRSDSNPQFLYCANAPFVFVAPEPP